MKVHLIVAHDANLGIGINGTLPWHIKDDLELFKHITNGNSVIMGRKTFESLPFKNGLPNRINFVITSQMYTINNDSNVIYVNSLQEAIDNAKRLNNLTDAYIIGGKSIYDIAIPYVTGNIYISKVHEDYICDTSLSYNFYKDIEKYKFIKVFKQKYSDFTFKIYKRIKDI